MRLLALMPHAQRGAPATSRTSSRAFAQRPSFALGLYKAQCLVLFGMLMAQAAGHSLTWWSGLAAAVAFAAGGTLAAAAEQGLPRKLVVHHAGLTLHRWWAYPEWVKWSEVAPRGAIGWCYLQGYVSTLIDGLAAWARVSEVVSGQPALAEPDSPRQLAANLQTFSPYVWRSEPTHRLLRGYVRDGWLAAAMIVGSVACFALLRRGVLPPALLMGAAIPTMARHYRHWWASSRLADLNIHQDGLAWQRGTHRYRCTWTELMELVDWGQGPEDPAGAPTAKRLQQGRSLDGIGIRTVAGDLWIPPECPLVQVLRQRHDAGDSAVSQN